MNKKVLDRYNNIIHKKINEEDEIADGIDPTKQVDSEYSDEFETEFGDIFDVEDDYVDELVDEIESGEFDEEVVEEEIPDKETSSEFTEHNTLNTLYDEESDYKDNAFKYVNGYWIAILGILAMAKKFPDCPIIHNYLTKPAPITEQAILEHGDYYTDPIASVKALKDNKTLKYYTWNAYINFFLELNGNYYVDIDEDKIRDLTNEMIFVDIMPHHIIRQMVTEFLQGDRTLDDCIEPLYRFNLMFNISPKFQEFCIVHKDDLLLEVPKEEKPNGIEHE